MKVVEVEVKPEEAMTCQIEIRVKLVPSKDQE